MKLSNDYVLLHLHTLLIRPNFLAVFVTINLAKLTHGIPFKSFL